MALNYELNIYHTMDYLQNMKGSPQLPVNIEQVTKTLITAGAKIGKNLGERLAEVIDDIIDNLLK